MARSDFGSLLSKRGYKLIKKVGEGSFGRATLVEDDTRRQAIIKTIDVSKASKRETDDAMKEANVLSALAHPFIVRHMNAFMESGWFNIVLEYCECSLDFRIDEARRSRKHISESVVLKWFCQAMLALKYIHGKHILHRDMKPANILLDVRGDAKLSDFGIARVLGCTMAVARTQTGTPYYLSPELCMEKPYSWSADVWAMGCILYEMCALKVAFDGVNVPTLVKKIIKEPLPKFPSMYSDFLGVLCEDMLRKDPSHRLGVDECLSRPEVHAVASDLVAQAEAATDAVPVRADSKGSMAYRVGDLVSYYSSSHNGWLPAKILNRDDSNRITLDLKPNTWLATLEQDQKLRPRPAPDLADHLNISRADSYHGRRVAYNVGDLVSYYSASHKDWLPAKVIKCHIGNGIVIDLKPGTWLGTGEQDQKIRPRASLQQADLPPQTNKRTSSDRIRYDSPLRARQPVLCRANTAEQRSSSVASTPARISHSSRSSSFCSVEGRQTRVPRLPAIEHATGRQRHCRRHHFRETKDASCRRKSAPITAITVSSQMVNASMNSSDHVDTSCCTGRPSTITPCRSSTPSDRSHHRPAQKIDNLHEAGLGADSKCTSSTKLSIAEREEIFRRSKDMGGKAGAEYLHATLPAYYWGISKEQFVRFLDQVSKAVNSGQICNETPSHLTDVTPYEDEKFRAQGPNIHQINDQFIKPNTDGDASPIPWASSAVSTNPIHGLECELFISHAWDEGIFEFGGNVTQAWPEECNGAYVCFLANPQHLDIGRLVSSPRKSPFYKVIAELPKHMLMVANSNRPIHSRLWCCYEAHCAWQLNQENKLRGGSVNDIDDGDSSIQISVAGNPLNLIPDGEHRWKAREIMRRERAKDKAVLARRVSHLQDETSTRRAELGVLLTSKVKLDIRDADCSSTADKASIWKEIKGHEASINEMIVVHMYDAFH